MIREIASAEIFAAPNAADLLAEYAAECSIPLIGKIDPRQEMYAAMERNGALQCFGAYAGNRLIGFAAVLTTVLPHYGKKVATMESLFVAKSGRKGGTGAELLKAVNQYAKETGCVAILYSAPAGGKLEKLLSRTCKQTNTVFCRSL